MPIRSIITHRVDNLDDAVRIIAVDEANPGGGCCKYRVEYGSLLNSGGTVIKFQEGGTEEAGINGLTNEALLAIVADRLNGFQGGPFSCQENATALNAVREALAALHARSAKRIKRGVEGKQVA